MKTQILTIGGKGLVGSRITELLSDYYTFEDISRSNGIDITNKKVISEKIKNAPAQIVIYYAAKADVEGCEKDKELDTKFQNGKVSEQEIITANTAWAIHVIGTKNVAQACEVSEKKMIHISTDFVFGADSPPEGGFTEKSMPSPVNWYGQTKYEAEKIVQSIKSPWIVIRPAYPYRANFTKNDFVRMFKTFLEQKRQLKIVTDHFLNPTFIDDIAIAINSLIKKDVTGIFHVTGSQTITPYEVCLKVAETFGLNKSLIGKTTREEFFKGKAKRPFNLSMNNAKIRKLGVQMKSFDEGLDEVKRQISLLSS